MNIIEEIKRIVTVEGVTDRVKVSQLRHMLGLQDEEGAESEGELKDLLSDYKKKQEIINIDWFYCYCNMIDNHWPDLPEYPLLWFILSSVIIDFFFYLKDLIALTLLALLCLNDISDRFFYFYIYIYSIYSVKGTPFVYFSNITLLRPIMPKRTKTVIGFMLFLCK